MKSIKLTPVELAAINRLLLAKNRNRTQNQEVNDSPEVHKMLLASSRHYKRRCGLSFRKLKKHTNVSPKREYTSLTVQDQILQSQNQGLV